MPDHGRAHAALPGPVLHSQRRDAQSPASPAFPATHVQRNRGRTAQPNTVSALCAFLVEPFAESLAQFTPQLHRRRHGLKHSTFALGPEPECRRKRPSNGARPGQFWGTATQPDRFQFQFNLQFGARWSGNADVQSAVAGFVAGQFGALVRPVQRRRSGQGHGESAESAGMAGGTGRGPDGSRD